MKEKLVSVIIPAYNSESTIHKCINSILSQTYKSIEVIVIDDGSNDSTSEIINSYKSKHDKIKLIKQKNRGLSFARNVGIDNASGEYILFVDSDDEVKQNIVELCVEKFKENIDSVWYKTEVRCAYDEQLRNNTEKWVNNLPTGYVYIDDNLMSMITLHAWSKMFKRKNFINHNIKFPEGLYYEDAVVHYNYFSIYRNAYMIDKFLYIYNINNNSIMDKTRRKTDGMSIHHIFLLEHIYSFWKKYKLIENREDFFELIAERYIKHALAFAQDYEQSRCIWGATKVLRKWKINYKRYFLKCLYDGIVAFNIGAKCESLNLIKTNRLLEESNGRLLDRLSVLEIENERQKKYTQKIEERLEIIKKSFLYRLGRVLHLYQ